MNNKPKEGDLYSSVRVFGHTFELYYGYYEDFERESRWSEPVPIYPNLKENPLYTIEGYPIVTRMQVACPFYDGPTEKDSCEHCPYFEHGELHFGRCTQEKRRNKQ